MNYSGLKVFLARFLFIFCFVFILTLPFLFFFLPNIGLLLKSPLEELTRFIFSIDIGVFYPDSPLSWYLSLLLLIFSAIISLIWTAIKTETGKTLAFFAYRGLLVFLIIFLLSYGFSKIFFHQFYPPEPNLLFTPLGQLTKDTLYWTSMGTSPIYSVFAGLIEVIPGILLLFRRTRLLGACISLLVLINVLFINIGFGITVKQLSLFLLLVNLVILAPYQRPLIGFFLQISNDNKTPNTFGSFPERLKRFYPFLKVLVILLIGYETAGVYLKTGYFSQSAPCQSELYGAYSLAPNKQAIKRVFFHSRNYFILQNDSDQFQDYAYRRANNTITLTDYQERESHLLLHQIDANNYSLSGVFYGDSIQWNLIKIPIQNLPINTF